MGIAFDSRGPVTGVTGLGLKVHRIRHHLLGLSMRAAWGFGGAEMSQRVEKTSVYGR